jgi:hypothetical protein
MYVDVCGCFSVFVFSCVSLGLALNRSHIRGVKQLLTFLSLTLILNRNNTEGLECEVCEADGYQVLNVSQLKSLLSKETWNKMKIPSV